MFRWRRAGAKINAANCFIRNTMESARATALRTAAENGGVEFPFTSITI